MDSPAPDESASIIGRDALELKNVAEYGTRGEPDGSETEPESMDSDAEYMRHDAEGEESSGSEGLEGGEGKKEKKKKRMREVWDNKVYSLHVIVHELCRFVNHRYYQERMNSCMIYVSINLC